MKRIFSSLTLLFLLTTSLITPAQVRNISSMKGTWTGQWVNTYYQSSGSISVTITVDIVHQTAHGDWTVGGNILGTPRAPFSTDITLTSTGFTASFNSSIWGDISGTGLFTGAYSGTAINCPNPNAQNISATGTFNGLTINGTFNFAWYGNAIGGTVTITKQNPVGDPTNLALNENPKGTINLTWKDNATNETGFRIERKTSPSGTWTQMGTVGANTTAYADNAVATETQYSYRVAAYSSTTESEYSNVDSIKTLATAVEGYETIPSDYLLLQNYPNPFNPSTVIRYDLPRESKVKISVYTMLGKLVAVLKNDIQSEGQYELRFEGGHQASGIYLVKMIAESTESGNKFVDYKKMVLIK
ncbi:MAG: T9SS type A sorting domain-containing protein [Bacteroidetes bacterium]|nr:T9SS type A sorting domain-containing protein [Bacteroidota bacterium]